MRRFVDDDEAHEAGIKTINTGLTSLLSGNYLVMFNKKKGESTSYRLGP